MFLKCGRQEWLAIDVFSDLIPKSRAINKRVKQKNRSNNQVFDFFQFTMWLSSNMQGKRIRTKHLNKSLLTFLRVFFAALFVAVPVTWAWLCSLHCALMATKNPSQLMFKKLMPRYLKRESHKCKYASNDE